MTVLAITALIKLAFRIVLISLLALSTLIVAIRLFHHRIRGKSYHSIATHPNFKKAFEHYFKDYEKEEKWTKKRAEEDYKLLSKFIPHVYNHPKNFPVIDFYEDYVANSHLRDYSKNRIIYHKVNQKILNVEKNNNDLILEFDYKKFKKSLAQKELHSKIYGRVYRKHVKFDEIEMPLIFLKYNMVLPLSGLAARSPRTTATLVKLAGMSAYDWHQLDNHVSYCLILREDHSPFAVMLTQHNYKRSYLVDKDLDWPRTNHLSLDIAKRSNELYLGSKAHTPQNHPVAQWALYMKYILTEEDPPLLHAHDVTYGQNAGGERVPLELEVLSPHDAFYTATIGLGEHRPFFGRYIGRDAPTGVNYHTTPDFIDLADSFKAFYLHDSPEDIAHLDQVVDLWNKFVNSRAMIQYGESQIAKILRKGKK